MDSHVHFLYKNIGYSEIGFSTFFTPPPILKHAILSHLGAKIEKTGGTLLSQTFKNKKNC